MHHATLLLAITLTGCVTVAGFPGSDSEGATDVADVSGDVAEAGPLADAAAVPDAAAIPDVAEVSDEGEVSEEPEVSQPGPSSPFPPPTDELPLLMRDAQVVDLNGDGRDDLVFNNVHADETAWGLVVAMGHEGGALDGYHAFVSTEVQPLGLAVKDVVGSSAPDLLVLGPDDQAGGVALVFETLDADAPSFATPLRHEVEIDDFPYHADGVSNPANITAAEVTGDGVIDLIVADFNHVTVLEPANWSSDGLAQASHRNLTLEDGVQFNHVSAVFVVDHPISAARYLVVKQQTSAVSFLVHEGVGVATSGTTAGTDDFGGLYRSTLADVDQDGVTDVIGYDHAKVRVHRLDPPDGFSVVDWDEPEGRGGPDHYEDIALADLTGEGSLDAVLAINREGLGSDSSVRVLRNLYVDGDVLHDTGAHVDAAMPPGFHPDGVRLGDFDGDGAIELLALRRTGESVCLRWDEMDKGLVPCVWE